MKKPLLVAASLFCSLLVGCAHAQTSSIAISPPKDFNGVILVAQNRNSEPLSKSYGFANQETGAKFDSSTKSQIGSVSKFLTSLVVLRLVERNQLSLDRPISNWLPFLEKSENGQVTLRQLMSNTSGIPNGVMASYKENPDFTSREISALEASKLWGTGKLEFQPGTDFDYSLTNWVIVRAIIESATGKPFESTMRDELIAPLNLHFTGIPGPSFPEDASFAQNYVSLQPSKTKQNKVPTYAAAAGTIYSSAFDLRKILDAVFDENYLKASSRKELLAVNFEKEGYALGGRVVDLPDTTYKILWEPGETSNYRALVAYEPNSGACIILVNNTGISPDDLADTARSTMRDLLKPN
jgi:D-alanyl-D-alanine carboxypeptidase